LVASCATLRFACPTRAASRQPAELHHGFELAPAGLDERVADDGLPPCLQIGDRSDICGFVDTMATETRAPRLSSVFIAFSIVSADAQFSARGEVDTITSSGE
jgi:hypothetical protein